MDGAGSGNGGEWGNHATHFPLPADYGLPYPVIPALASPTIGRGTAG